MLPTLLGTLKDEISSFKFYFNDMLGAFYCNPALPGTLDDESHPSINIFMLCRMCVDAFLRLRQRWQIKSYLSNFIWIIYTVCFHALLPAGSIERWDLIFQALYSCFILCVLMLSCAAGNLGGCHLIFQTFFLCFILCVLMQPWASGGIKRWDLIVQAFFLRFIGCVLMHSCAAGSLEKWDLVFRALFSLCI